MPEWIVDRVDQEGYILRGPEKFNPWCMRSKNGLFKNLVFGEYHPIEEIILAE
jgi:hypothetical protein